VWLKVLLFQPDPKELSLSFKLFKIEGFMLMKNHT